MVKKKIKSKITFAVLILAVVLAGLFWIYWFFWPKNSTLININPTDNILPAQIKFPSQLDGLEAGSKENQVPAVVGVMIDNHPEAQPASGLNEAKIVYEAPAEGGITRYLAIFDKNQLVEKVGPVRSARPYYLGWLQEYGDGLYMHCGGSPAALDLIEENNIFDANEFYNSQYYWRDEKRSAPHNLYTSSENWNKNFSDKGDNRPASAWSGWNFDQNFNPTNFTPVKEIKIAYSPDYEVVWKYNIAESRFELWLNGKQYLDDNNQPIWSKNILIQLVQTKILDEVGRREITQIGEGEGKFLLNGKLLQAHWKKSYTNDRTRFYTANDQEIKLFPGKIWVEIVPVNSKITVVN